MRPRGERGFTFQVFVHGVVKEVVENGLITTIRKRSRIAHNKLTFSGLFVEQPFCGRMYFHWDAIYLNRVRIGVCQD